MRALVLLCFIAWITPQINASKVNRGHFRRAASLDGSGMQACPKYLQSYVPTGILPVCDTDSMVRRPCMLQSLGPCPTRKYQPHPYLAVCFCSHL